MRKTTDSKTIKGKIIKVGCSRQYCTSWGEMLFKGREIIVCVNNIKHKRQTIPMYIRDDSDVGILHLSQNVLLGKEWELSIHGELNTPSHGCIFIDSINLSAHVAKQIPINNYF